MSAVHATRSAAEHGASLERRAARGKRMALATALFSILFTSDLKIPVPPFDGLPAWLVVALPILLVLATRARQGRTILISAAVIGVTLLSHLFLTHASFDYIPLQRSLIQIGVLTAILPLLIGALRGEPYPIEAAVWAIKAYLLIQIVVMVAQVALDIHPAILAYRHYFLPIWRVSGLWREPSHVAVAMSAPFALMFGFPGFWRKTFGLRWSAAVAFIALICPSSSMMWPALGGLIVFALRSETRLAAIFPPIAAVAMIGPMLVSSYRYSNPLMERIWDAYQLIFVGTKSDYMNASSMVLAKGVFIMKQTLANHPLGFGIDNLFYANDLYGGAFSFVFRSWNARDSASLLIKFVTEFGWLGAILCAAAALMLAIRVRNKQSQLVAMGAAIALVILIGNTGRGSGYFDFGALLIPAALIAFAPPKRARVATWARVAFAAQ